MKIKTIELDDGQTSATTPSLEILQGVTGVGAQGIQGVGMTGISTLGDLQDCEGSGPIGIGEGAGSGRQTEEVAIGIGALPSSGNGYNTAIGYQALGNHTVGYGCVGVGFQSNYTNEESVYNVGVGVFSGASKYNNSSYCVGVGYNARGQEKTFVLGNNSYVYAKHSIILGDDMEDLVYKTGESPDGDPEGENISENQVVLGGENITSTILRGVVRIEDESSYSDIEGTVRYDSTAHAMKIYNGTSWVDL